MDHRAEPLFLLPPTEEMSGILIEGMVMVNQSCSRPLGGGSDI